MNKNEKPISTAEVIRELRKVTGLSQAKFAAKFSISVSNVQHWEQGVSTPPKYVVSMMKDLLYMERFLKEVGDDDSIDKDIIELRKEINDKVLLRGSAIALLHAIAESYVSEVKDKPDSVHKAPCSFSDSRLLEMLQMPGKDLQKNIKTAMHYILDHPYVICTDKCEIHYMWVSSFNYRKGKGLDVYPNTSILDVYEKIGATSEPDYGLSEYL